MFLGAENNNVGLKQENSTPHTQMHLHLNLKVAPQAIV